MTTAYFDCFNGAAGDMIVVSFIDAGADADALRERLAALPVGGYTMTTEKVNKQGFAATRFLVRLDLGAKQPHRHLKDVVAILDDADLPPRVIDRAKLIFTRLAKAEAKVHGTSVDKVHFHEVGAVDAIIDVTGAALALDMLGVDRVICSPIPVGSGTSKLNTGTSAWSAVIRSAVCPRRTPARNAVARTSSPNSKPAGRRGPRRVCCRSQQWRAR